MNKNKKIIIITIISLIVLTGIYLLYNTYALTTKTTNNGDYYTINLTDSNIVSLAANEEKTVIYQINNTNNGTVSYGVAYNNSNIEVKVYSDSKDKVTGTIGANDNKYIKLHLKNKTSSNTTVEITAVMGYENGGDLIVPSDSTLVTKTYTNSFAGYITELYDNSTKTPVTNNSITYQYDTTNNLMKDTAGNIRYYGASPNNYIYFNCDSYPSTNCELWRIIGVFDGKVKLIRKDNETSDDLPIEDILKNVDVKTNDLYISGIGENKNVSYLINLIKQANTDVNITITNKDNTPNNSILKTGDKLIIKNNSYEKTYTIVIKGDTNGDGKITAVDLLRIQKHILKYTTLKDEYYEACDTNYDNSVSPVDMLRIKKHILKYITLK